MMKKAIIMTTDVIVRYASNINFENEITDFHWLGISGAKISAISWELKNIKRVHGISYLTKQMINKLSGNNDSKTIHLYIQFDHVPDNRIIRYKKAWGLIKGAGHDVDFMSGKHDIISSNTEGLSLSAIAYFHSNLLTQLNYMISQENKIFFAYSDPACIKKNT